MDMDAVDEMRERFNANLIKLIENKSVNSCFLTKEKYVQLRNVVKELKHKTSGKTPADYQRLKRYDVIKIGECEKLIYPVYEISQSVRYYVCVEELFDVIHDTHIIISHAGRNRMIQALRQNYKNITTESVMLYLNLCESCRKKLNGPKKALVATISSETNRSCRVDIQSRQKDFAGKSMVLNEMNSRCQVDVVDMECRLDEEFKFILVYQDYITKFIQLRALKSKRVEDVAYTLLDIFSTFGAPCILQTDIGSEFTNNVIEKLCSLWDELKIVYGKSRHDQSRGERTHQVVKNMLNTWSKSNPTRSWSEGLHFVQLTKNRTFREDIKCSPYEAMFGTPIRIGLKASRLLEVDVIKLKTENELESVLKNFDNDGGASETRTNSLGLQEIVVEPDINIKIERNMNSDEEGQECTDIQECSVAVKKRKYVEYVK